MTHRFLDSIPNKRLLQRLLSLKGISSDGIEDGTQVVDLVSKDLYRYDVILMDRMMSGVVSPSLSSVPFVSVPVIDSF
jgi:CheY-like chemotaxis protein